MGKTAKGSRLLPSKDAQQLLGVLKARFEKNGGRHKGVDWSAVEARLSKDPDKLWSLNAMEETGGEPDVVAVDKKSGLLTFFDCSAESPAGRRSYCYDHEALESRKANKPADSAVNKASEMGVGLITEEEYKFLQTLGKFDQKTSSWVLTPPEVRKLGGAIFCDLRFGRVFTYHNGAESYYAARAFRCSLQV